MNAPESPTPTDEPNAAEVIDGDAQGKAKPGSRRRRWIVLGTLLVLLGWDLSRAPGDQWSAAGLLAGIDLYQATASRWMPGLGVHCRFHPTCSHFAEGAIRRDGALVGTLRSAGRILRCGPWTEAGTLDPP